MLNIYCIVAVFFLPTLVYAEKELLVNQDQKLIFEKLSKQHGFEQRIASITKKFTIIELESDEGFSVSLLSKGPERLSLSIRFIGTGGFHHDGFNPPQGRSLSTNQIESINEIFQRQNKLWMFAPENASLIPYDLSNGYEGLAKQRLFSRTNDKEVQVEVTTRLDGDIATIYYKNSDDMSVFDDTFYINVDLKSQNILNALWIDLRINNNKDLNFEARMMSGDEFNFINKCLIRGGYPGLYELIKTDKITLSFGLDELSNKPVWSLGTDPINGRGHSQHFTIDAKSGEISIPLTMNIMRTPAVTTTLNPDLFSDDLPDNINVNEHASSSIPEQELKLDGQNEVKTITLFPNKPYDLDNTTTITVMTIIEKRMSPDRRSVMKITLKFKSSNKTKTIVFDSDNPNFSWQDYKFKYLGGWRTKVELKVIQ